MPDELPPTFTSQDDIPEALRSYYVEHDGVFKPNIPGGFKTADEISGLESSLRKERENAARAARQAKELGEKLKPWEGKDPEQVTEILEKFNTEELQKLKDDGNLEAVIQRRTETMTRQHQREAEAWQNEKKGILEEKSALQGHLDNLVLNDAANDIAKKAGVKTDNYDDVKLALKSDFTVRDGKPVMLDEYGEIKTGKDGKSPYTPEEWIEDKRPTKLKAWWPQSDGPHVPGGKHGARTVDTSKMSGNQMIEAALSGS